MKNTILLGSLLLSTSLVIAADQPASVTPVAAPAPAPTTVPIPAADAKPKEPLSFFVTSAGIGKGAELGGLAGADAHCQKLAEAAGSVNKTWHAYLSTQAADGQPVINARDRIGSGPWYNAKGAEVAKNIADLHCNTLELARLGK
ncbi:MAG: lectin, partial [Methylobacter tundripaludum]|nr:lectin [Methylobacter tundripaludum]